MLVEVRDAVLGFRQLALRILVLLLEAFTFCHHILRAISDSGEFAVNFYNCRIQRWELHADSAFVRIPYSRDFS